MTVGDIRTEFYGSDNLGGPVAFPNRWQQSSVVVTHGEIVLARTVNQPETVYALKLFFQPDKKMRLSYVALRAAAQDVAPSDAKAKKTISSVTISGATYANVVVESVTDKTITFAHSRGIASVNPKNLDPAEREALGLQTKVVKEQKAEVIESKTTTVSKVTGRVQIPDSVKDFARKAGAIALGIVIALVVFYLFNCLCLLLICNKTEHPAPLLVWIPVLQILAMYRAAEMSPFWFRALIADLVFRFGIAGLAMSGVIARDNNVLNPAIIYYSLAVTIVHVIGWCVWCFKICVARGKHPLFGLFVLFPITQPPALAYLAFSK